MYVSTPYDKLTCTATVKSHSDTWYTVATDLDNIDNGDAYKYETFVEQFGQSMGAPATDSHVVSTSV